MLTGKGDQVEAENIPTQDEYDLVLAGNFNQYKSLVTVLQSNELTHEEIILIINLKAKEGNVAF